MAPPPSVASGSTVRKEERVMERPVYIPDDHNAILHDEEDDFSNPFVRSSMSKDRSQQLNVNPDRIDSRMRAAAGAQGRRPDADNGSKSAYPGGGSTSRAGAAADIAQPPPALPDELLAALARDPNEAATSAPATTPAKSPGALHAPSHSSSNQLPNIAPYSPFSLKGVDGPWASQQSTKASNKSSSHQGTGVIAADTGTPSTTPVTPAIGLQVAPSGSPAVGKGLRKASSAESLRKRVRSNAGMAGFGSGLGGHRNDEGSGGSGRTAASADSAKEGAHIEKDGQLSEIKSLWKSLAHKLGGSGSSQYGQNKGKEREHTSSQGSASTAASANLGVDSMSAGVAVGRRSADHPRHSLSVYPRQSVDVRPSASSASLLAPLHSDAQMSSGMARSRSGPDMLGTGTGAGTLLNASGSSTVPVTGGSRFGPLRSLSLSTGQRPMSTFASESSATASVNANADLYAASGVRPANLDIVNDEGEGDGAEPYDSPTTDFSPLFERETFVKDLRGHRTRRSEVAGAGTGTGTAQRQGTPSSKPSMVNLNSESTVRGRTTPMPALRADAELGPRGGLPHRNAGDDGEEGFVSSEDELEDDLEDEEDEMDGEGDETSEVVSQLSYVDSADLALVEDRDTPPPAASARSMERKGTVRRRGSTAFARPSSDQSRARKPSRVSTPGSSAHSPAGDDSDVSPATARAARQPLTPLSPVGPLSPSDSIHTTRPRSISESALRPPVSAETPSSAPTAPNTHGASDPSAEQAGERTAPYGGYVRARSGSSGNLLKELAAPRKSIADFVIAVIGPKQVGKSTIIERNLKQARDKSGVLYEDESGNRVVSYVGNFSVCGIDRTIEILEADMDILKNTSEGLLWPKYLPKLDGAMICYKQGDPRALEDLTMLLQGFWTRGGVHLIALATHCGPDDKPSAQQQGQGDKAAEICNIHGAGLVHLDGGMDDPNRKAKNSLQWILRKVLDSRAAAQDSSRSPSRTKRLPKSDKPAALAMKKSSVLLIPPADASELSGEQQPLQLAVSAPAAPLPSAAIASFSPTSHTHTDDSLNSPSIASSGSLSGPPPKFSQLDIYLSRDALIQKFLFAAVTGNDDQHLSIFLIVYRRFARPFDVLSALVDRFTSTAGHITSDPLLSRFAQMKLCNTLTRWVEHHPGDFSSPATLHLLESFVDQLFASTWVHQYGMELVHLVKSLPRYHDQESAWALPDRLEPTAQTKGSGNAGHLQPMPPERRPSLVPSLDSSYSSSSNTNGSFSPQAGAGPHASSTTGTPLTPTLSNGQHSQSPSDISGASKSATSLVNRGRSYSDAGTNASSDVGSASYRSVPSLASRESTRRHAVLLEASNLVLETPIERLATQITKLAWDIFSRMTPRDLLRYVMAPRDPKNPGAPPIRNETNPVSKAIGFGNMLADWTASLVMVQNKQRTRVRLIEHLIRLSVKLRELDNYDCLMAVLLGLNCQPIHRLDEMNEFIPPDLMKRFKSMNRLMASSRSFAAYRLAIVNARPEMIPYLGIHLQDVTRLNDGKSDMRDGLVNWNKMKAIGKHCAIVIDCSRLAPHYPNNVDLSRLITRLPLFSLNDDDALYDLSYSYKPRQSRTKSQGGSSQTKKLRRLFLDAISPNSAVQH